MPDPSPHSELVAAIRAELFERSDIPSDAPQYIARDQERINASHDALDALAAQLEVRTLERDAHFHRANEAEARERGLLEQYEALTERLGREQRAADAESEELSLQINRLKEQVEALEGNLRWAMDENTEIKEQLETAQRELAAERKTAAYLDGVLARHHETTGWNCPVCNPASEPKP